MQVRVFDKVLAVAVIALCIAGCGETRSVPPGTDNGPDQGFRAPAESPVFTSDYATVHDGVIRACIRYFHHIDKEMAAGRIVYVEDYCFWGGGTTENTISLSQPAENKIMVTIESHAGSPSGIRAWDGSRERQIIDTFIEHLREEMQILLLKH